MFDNAHTANNKQAILPASAKHGRSPSWTAANNKIGAEGVVVEVKRKILLVTDDSKGAGLIKKLLARAPGMPIEVRLAGDLSSALKSVGTGTLDAILVDLALKDSSGPAILDAVKTRANGTPVIALGESGGEDFAAAAIRLGIQDYLVKGQFESDSLIRVIRYADERKRAGEALRESEERYRRLVEISPDAILVHSEGDLVLVNDAAVTLLGATGPEELIGRPIVDFVRPKDCGGIL